jgi:hypothetical protein
MPVQRPVQRSAESHPTPPPKVVHAGGQKVPEHLSTAKPAITREEKIDAQMEDSFPASDPPSFSGGNHIIGAPVARESDAATGEAPEVKKAEKKVHDGDCKRPGTY